MKNRLVLKPSNSYTTIGVGLALIGLLAGWTMVRAALDQGDAAFVAFAAFGCGVFVIVGLALVFKSRGEWITVYATGIAKNSPPLGKRTFQANWDEVMAYEVARDVGYFESGEDTSIYVLTSPKAQMRFSTYDDYFAVLHSLILTNLPPKAHVRLARTTTGRGERVEAMQEFRMGSRARSCVQVALGSVFVLGCVAIAVLPWVFDTTTPTPVEMKALGTMMGAFGAIIGLRATFGSSASADDSVRLSSEGVSYFDGAKRVEHIPWDALRAVVYLYLFRSKDEHGQTRSLSYHYAVVGTEGHCFHFSSKAPDFVPLLRALVGHSPPEAAIYLHRELN